jgi:hypothetical protein
MGDQTAMNLLRSKWCGAAAELAIRPSWPFNAAMNGERPQSITALLPSYRLPTAESMGSGDDTSPARSPRFAGGCRHPQRT